MSGNELELVKNGIGVSIGLLVMLFAAQTFYWSGYMSANPDVTNVSTSSGFAPFWAAIFVLGATTTYVFFMRGFASTLATATN